MKFLILNDSHDKGNNPVRRTDNYHRSILEKLDETLSIAKDKKVDKIIHAGDVWHTPNVSWTIIDDWIDRIESCGIEMLVVPGNHDMDGASWETSGKTALYHAFKRSKLLTFLDEFSGEDCFVKGYPYYFDCELDIKENGLKHKWKYGLSIAVTHAFISPEPFPFSNYVLPKEIKSNYDYVICSHLHKAFYIEVGKTKYINLGCFGRTAISEAKHMPQIGILDTEENTYDVIPLKSSKKGTECFDYTEVQNKKDFRSSVDKFIESVGNIDFQGKSVEENIRSIAEEKNFAKDVVRIIQDRIKAVQIESNN